MKESSSSRTLKSLFLILSLNTFLGSSLRERIISLVRVSREHADKALQSNHLLLLKICGQII